MNFIIRADEQLDIIEMIFNKYLELPNNLLFVKNNRLPLLGDEKQLALRKYPEHYFSNRPWHPFLCIGCVIDVLEIMIYSKNEYRDDLIKNKLIPSGGKEYMSEHRLLSDYREIVFSHIFNNSYIRHVKLDRVILHHDVEAILRHIHNIYRTIEPAIMQNQDAIYDFDISTGIIVVSKVGHILELRYLETVKYMDSIKVKSTEPDHGSF